MARPGRGPRLVRLRKPGWSQHVYYIRWTENGRTRERSTGAIDINEAEASFRQWLQGRAKPKHTGPRDPSQARIVDVLADYAEHHAPETAAPERIAFAMDRLLDWWGDLSVDAIRSETCRRYRQDREASDGTIRRELGVLRAALNYGVKEGHLTKAPYLWLPPKPAGKDRWLTRAEAAALLTAAMREPKARSYLPLFILIGLYTGARKEAILSLRWTQIDLVRNRIDFNMPGRLQTTKRRPIIPIPRGLSWFLRKAHERASSPHVVHRDGERLGDIKKSFAAACRRAGLTDVTPHSLRHTAGTWMAQQGVDLWQIGGFLGHSYHRTTELYGHHHPDYLEQAKSALD